MGQGARRRKQASCASSAGGLAAPRHGEARGRLRGTHTGRAPATRHGRWTEPQSMPGHRAGATEGRAKPPCQGRAPAHRAGAALAPRPRSRPRQGRVPAMGPRLRAGATRAGRRAERDEGEGGTGGLEGESERNGEEMGHGLRASWARDDREAVGGARRRRGTGTRVRPGGWDPPTGGSDAPARAR